MNDEDLKKLWQEQPLRVPAPSPTQLISAMQNRTSLLRRCLNARDLRELVVCVIVVIVFGVFYFTVDSERIARVGDLIIIGSAIFIGWKFVYTQRSTPPAPPGATIVESLRAELNSTRAQSRLLGTVQWWYLLPLTIGWMVTTWGRPMRIHEKIISSVIFIAVDVLIWWLNQWARRKQLLPVEAQLESLLHSAETGEPPEVTHVANLRPIVLSMTAADQVKPAEFKVAFWQIALYGEIGFAGMWFFLMLGLDRDHILQDLSRGSLEFFSQFFSPLHLVWLVAFFLGGIVYSLLLQRTTERAVGISSLGIHLQKGQNLILWDEIKEVRPLRLLNIRSLWLIRESGEKTITPWTSLERHADLRAAVESCAPVNHPIHKYLSLLMKSKKSLGLVMLALVLAGTAAVGARQFAKTNSAVTSSSATSIEVICKEHKVPALVVVVAKDGKICDRAAAGVRKLDDPTPATTNDVFHIGSCTKSMTATLAAMFIEQGKLRWDTTIAEMFPELKGKMDKRYETVTVEQLLHHRGGVPHAPPPAAWARAWQEIGTPAEQRREYLEAVLSAPPEAKPGTKMIYSNDGYVIVGVMLEKISGRDFESLMTEKLFKPLQMATAGFGAPGTKGKVAQPWGHVHTLFGNRPLQKDNPPVHSPCGRVHCSIDDLARFAMFHLQRGTNGLLKPETLARLHASPVGVEINDLMDDYACGWVRMQRDWAGGPVLWHNGSNSMWYIVMWLAPEKDFCVIAATNVAGDDAEKACDDACVAMIDKWLPK